MREARRPSVQSHRRLSLCLVDIVRPIEKHMHVAIGHSDLAWFVEYIDGDYAILTSGQTLRLRREPLANLRPWGSVKPATS